MYATLADMVREVGERRLATLTDEAGETVDPMKVDGAIAAASAEIDTYLRPRHKLPLPTIPARLVSVACDLAHYRLCQGENNLVSDQVQTAQEQALKWLDKLATGKVDLGLDTGGTPVKVSGGARLSSAGRMFSRRKLRGF